MVAAGIIDAAISVLLILTSVVFGSLREEHFGKLLPKMKIGEHATLLIKAMGYFDCTRDRGWRYIVSLLPSLPRACAGRVR